MSDCSFSLDTYQTILYNVFHRYNEQQTHTDPTTTVHKASVYTMQKLDTIMSDLQTTLETTYALFEKREEQRIKIEETQRDYIDMFIKNSSRQLFYIPKTDIYLKYNGTQVDIVNENSIWHNVLSELSNSSHPLFSRRYMVKISVMHALKQQNILGITPSSQTIQHILGILTPTFLETKEAAKHFLTVLGDMMLRKNNLIYLVDTSCKAFLEAIEQYIYFYWAGSIKIDGFKYKYYDHTYKDCRLIRFNKSIENQDIWDTFLKKNILEIVMVATHYSTRYGSADQFMEKCYNEDLEEYVFYLKNHTKHELVNRFIEQYLERSSTNEIAVPWNQMNYLWRMFIEEEGIPSVVMTKQLKELLMEHGIPCTQDIFYGVSSKYLQTVKDFETFWTDHIEEDPQEILETGELLIAYNQWAYAKRLEKQSISKLTETKISLFVQHFHGFTVDNRVVHGIGVPKWNRASHIHRFLTEIYPHTHTIPKHWTEVYEELLSQWSVMTDVPPVSMDYFKKWLTCHQYTDWIA